MGGWKLEVFRMGSYLAFPVTLFYCFNKSFFHERYMMNRKKSIFPLDDPDAELIVKAEKEAQRRREMKWEEELRKQTLLWEEENKQ